MAAKPNAAGKKIEAVVNLAKRRGLVYPCGEIYGGTKSAWDYGPLGVELKENIKKQWWRSVVTSRDDVVGLDSSVILPRQVWVASGHVEVFNDPLVECLNCHKRHRQDHLQEAYSEKEAKKGLTIAPESVPMTEIVCPDCGNKGQWTEPRDFNMMLKTYLGPIETEEGLHYLRPETAQGIFINFKNVVTTSRQKPPFGIGQIGKSFRNEITPGNFIFRTREFEQMEMEFFVEPSTAPEWHKYWIDTRLQWYVDLGIDPENLRLYDHPKEKLSHYSDGTVDIEYKFGFSGNPWGELEGIANRTDFDLSTHAKHSGEDLSYYDQAEDRRYTPYVIEPAAGLTRSFMAFLVDAYHEDEAPNAKGGVDTRTVLRLDPRLAPVKVAVLPLSRNADLSPRAKALAAELRQSWNVDFDDAGAIGRRYRRQDEIGTPFCVTVDFDSLEDDSVTVRDRDEMTQQRIPIGGVADHLAKPSRAASRGAEMTDVQNHIGIDPASADRGSRGRGAGPRRRPWARFPLMVRAGDDRPAADRRWFGRDILGLHRQGVPGLRLAAGQSQPGTPASTSGRIDPASGRSAGHHCPRLRQRRARRACPPGRRARARNPEQGVLHQRWHRGRRACGAHGAPPHRASQSACRIPQLPRRHHHLDVADG